MKKEKIDVLELFHHIHHKNKEHEVHHCGKTHDSKLDYEIKHCNCNKHSINKKEAVGHDLELKEILVKFNEECPEGGWHIETGNIIKKKKKEILF